jgi:macrolide transport system ATP-binding/permease protein
MPVFLVDVMRQVLRQFRFNFLRTSLATLGVMIGITALVSIDAIGRGTKDRLIANMANLGYATMIEIAPDPTVPDTRTDYLFDDSSAASFAAEIPSVVAGTEVAEKKGVVIRRQGNAVGVWLIGAAPGYFDVFNLNVSGTAFFPAQAGANTAVCVIGAEIAQALFHGLDHALDQPILIGDSEFTVVGVLHKSTWRNFDLAVLVPSESFRRVIPFNQASEKLSFKVSAPDAVGWTSNALRERVRLFEHARGARLVLSTNESSLETVKSSTRLLQLFLFSVASITILSGGIGIMNIQLASVVQRSRELAIKRTVGASPADIFFEILLESTLLGLSAGLAGICTGVLLGTKVSDLVSARMGMHIESAFSATTILGIFLLSGALTTLFGLVPALRALQPDIVVSLKNE